MTRGLERTEASGLSYNEGDETDLPLPVHMQLVADRGKPNRKRAAGSQQGSARAVHPAT
jgi:hypothetical protein